jgi:hypothetical protein
MRQIEARLLALWERLARENRRLLALLRAGHSLVEAEEALMSEKSTVEPTDSPADEHGER